MWEIVSQVVLCLATFYLLQNGADEGVLAAILLVTTTCDIKYVQS